MNVSEIRQKFIDFFAANGHTPIASSPLVPGNDPTLLFTNAGMVQFKDVFLGLDKRPYNRAVTSQRCVRAGGKHNDLENVGYTARHHTFFEMLGNFSFGDYFKREAIHYAWELVTKVYGLPADKLWTTVYIDDDEAYRIWTEEIGVPHERCVRLGDKPGGKKYESDNFWMMADTGPCGPCSEIFYDHGPAVAGGPPGSADADGDRYIEIWNLVFMQFNKDEAGTLNPLPKPSVDTGMGLERLSAVLQHVHSNYEIDLFQSLVNAAAKATGTSDLKHPSLRVIADHIRACSFLVCDGVIPSNEGRGYVLRRIARRAMRHGYKLGQKQPFFYTLVSTLAEVMGAAYPELVAQQSRIVATLKQEEERFGETLEHGMAILDAALSQKANTLDGETAFKLHDTYGFPIDLTADIGRERGFAVDMAGYDNALKAAQERSRAASKFVMKGGVEYAGAATRFRGYDALATEATVLALYREGVSVQQLQAGESGIVVLDDTPFYAESGGQVGDRGVISAGAAHFTVHDTQKIQAEVFGHHGELSGGNLAVGAKVQASVNAELRQLAVWNHSATHLMHAALRKVLGSHVQQKGSLVDEHKTRFDFTHNAPLSLEQIGEVERIVNREIQRNHVTDVSHSDFDTAVKRGAMALFGEKYGDVVRVVAMGDAATELCGGTHVERTGDIGLFRIVSEGGVAAGVRRVEALTGPTALAFTQKEATTLVTVADSLKAQPDELGARVAQLQESLKALEKELQRTKAKLAASQGDELLQQTKTIAGVKVLAVAIEGADAPTLRTLLDGLRPKIGSGIILLGSGEGGKVSLIAGVTADLTARFKAGDLVNLAAQKVGGKGGGRPDMAQAGGTEVAKLAEALAVAADWVATRG
jgi:alanyl-tRNA synthetase